MDDPLGLLSSGNTSGVVDDPLGLMGDPTPIKPSEPPSSNPLTNLAKGIGKGVVYGIPEQLAKSAQFLGIGGDTAKQVSDWAGKNLEGEPGIMEQAGQMIPQSVGIPLTMITAGKVIGTIPSPYGITKGVGLTLQLLGKYATPALFGLSQAQTTRDAAKEAGVDEGIIPYVTGGIEWAGETLANMALGRLLGPLGNITVEAMAKGSVTSALKGTIGGYVKEMALRTLPTEISMEMGQNYFEALAEQRSGIRPDAQPMQEAISAIGPTAVMSLLLGGAGGVARNYIANKQSAILAQPADENSPEFDNQVKVRSDVARLMSDTIPDESLRNQWLDYASQKIERNLPIDINAPLDSLSMEIDSLMDEMPEESGMVKNVVTPAPVEEEIDQEVVAQPQPEPEIIPESPVSEPTTELPPTNLPAPPEIVESGANGEVVVGKVDEQGAEEVSVSPEDQKAESIFNSIMEEGQPNTGDDKLDQIILSEVEKADVIEPEMIKGIINDYEMGVYEVSGREEVVSPAPESEPIPESTPTTPDYESEAKSLGITYGGEFKVPGKPSIFSFTDPTNAEGSFSLREGESLPDKLAKEREKKQKGLTPEQMASLGKGVENVPKVEKVAEVDQVSKEPWQMTRDEYIDPRFEEQRYQGISSGAPSSYVKTHERSVRDKIAQEHDDLIQKAIEEGKSVPIFNKPIWMRTQKEQLEYSQKRMRDAGNPEADSPEMREADIADHKQEVKFALEEGKPVPESVLKDYPDLIPPTAEAQKEGQRRAKVGGEFGENGEWYEGGQWIANTEMPKKHKERIYKAASGREIIEPAGKGKPAIFDIPPSGKIPIAARLIGTVMDGDGNLNRQFIEYQQYPIEQIKQFEKAAEAWKRGERYLDVNEYPLIGTFADIARLVKDGKPVPDVLFEKMPIDIAENFKKLERSNLSSTKPVAKGTQATKEKIAKIASTTKSKQVDNKPDMAKEMFPDEKIEKLKFGDVKPEDQWDGWGDDLSDTIRQQWKTKLEGFENEFRRTEEENRIGKNAGDSGMGGENGISIRRRLRDRRLFDAQVQRANRGNDRERWETVSIAPGFGKTIEFKFAEKHFESLGYQTVPINRVPWGMAVNHEDKVVFMGRMMGDRFAYFMSHETSHILTEQGNKSALAVKDSVDLTNPKVIAQREGRDWTDDYTKDEVAAAIIGGTVGLEDVLIGDQRENIKQAREATTGKQENIKTNTPEFKKWFGDSKVVDENGEPLVVYHGTGEDFSIPQNEYWATKYPDQASGISELRATLRGGAANVQPVYLSIKKPYIFISTKEDISAEEKLTDLPAKYDGMIVDNIHFVALQPNQIKSATANIGTFDINNPDIRYGDIIPANIKQSITDLTNKFQSSPQSTVPDEWLKSTLQPFIQKGNTAEFRFFEKYFGLPWTNAKKWVKEWGGAVKILLIERPEERARLQHEFSRIAEPFFTLADKMRKAGQSKEAIADSQDRLARVIITGDAQLGVELKALRAQYRELKDGPEREIIANKIAQIEKDNRYSDEQLLAGIKDDRGKTVKLNQQEIEAYKAVRSSLDFMFDSYMEHLLTQTFRNYKNQKWYSILCQAVGMDLTKEQTISIVGKGLKKAALLKAKSIQPNIHRIFNRVDQAITETPDNEKMEAGKLYGKLADKMTKEISDLRNAISELSGVTDQAQLNKMTKDVFDAYLFTRPATKQIKAMRNQYKKHVAFFPRVREQGKYKLQAVRNVYDEEGNLKKQVKLYSDFFNSESEGRDLYSEILDRFGKDGKLPDDIEVLPPEPASQAPEFAFQGVNDINVQKIFDNAMKEMKIESTFFNDKGEEVNIQNHIQRLGYEAIAKQFQSRGFGRHMIHRQVNVVKGYKETGLERILYDYISGMSGIMTKQVAAADYLDHMKTIKDSKQFAALAKYGSDQFRNDTTADRLSSKVRSFMFTWYLGGVLRPAIIQLTQNFVTGIPKHAQYLRENNLGGAGKADIDYIRSMKDMALFAKIGKKYQTWRYDAQDKGKELTLNDKENWLKSHGSSLSAIEADMQAQLLTDGITVDQFIREIRGTIGNKWENGMERWMGYLAIPFSRMEIFNRQSAALTRFRPAYKLALKKVGKEIDGQTFTEEDAYNEAFASSRKFVYDTHYPIGKAALPQVAQGPGLGIALKTGYTFKSFTHNFALQTYYDTAAGDWKTVLHSMAYLALFGGLLGLPFLDDLFEFIEKHFGYSPSTAVRQSLRGMGGKTLEQFGMNGLPAMLGMNMSGSLAMGVPFMGVAPESTIGGVYEGQRQKLVRAFDAYARADYYRVASNLAPEFLRGPITAAQESQVGKELLGTPGSATTTRGGLVYDKEGKPLSMTGYQAALKSVGFTPLFYSREREMDATIKRQKAWVDGRKADIAETYRVMKINKDPDAMRDMIKAVRDLNQDIKDRDLTQLVPRATVGKIIQSSRQIKNLQERRQEKYKRAEL